jgi:hypothetical protein
MGRQEAADQNSAQKQEVPEPGIALVVTEELHPAGYERGAKMSQITGPFRAPHPRVGR